MHGLHHRNDGCRWNEWLAVFLVVCANWVYQVGDYKTKMDGAKEATLLRLVRMRLRCFPTTWRGSDRKHTRVDGIRMNSTTASRTSSRWLWQSGLARRSGERLGVSWTSSRGKMVMNRSWWIGLWLLHFALMSDGTSLETIPASLLWKTATVAVLKRQWRSQTTGRFHQFPKLSEKTARSCLRSNSLVRRRHHSN